MKLIFWSHNSAEDAWVIYGQRYKGRATYSLNLHSSEYIREYGSVANCSLRPTDCNHGEFTLWCCYCTQ
jgi:hypothetical protein